MCLTHVFLDFTNNKLFGVFLVLVLMPYTCLLSCLDHLSVRFVSIWILHTNMHYTTILCNLEFAFLVFFIIIYTPFEEGTSHRNLGTCTDRIKYIFLWKSSSTFRQVFLIADITKHWNFDGISFSAVCWLTSLFTARVGICQGEEVCSMLRQPTLMSPQSGEGWDTPTSFVNANASISLLQASGSF